MEKRRNGETEKRGRRLALFPRFPGSPNLRFLFLILCFFCACAPSSAPQVIIHSQKGDPVRVRVEIADTEEKRQFGLMYRQELPELQGMLFLFPREASLSFWMKNTPLPLDIIFINAAYTIISIAQNTTPFSERRLPSGSPAQFVLEVNGGFCQRHGVAVGNRIEFSGTSPPLS